MRSRQQVRALTLGPTIAAALTSNLLGVRSIISTYDSINFKLRLLMFTFAIWDALSFSMVSQWPRRVVASVAKALRPVARCARPACLAAVFSCFAAEALVAQQPPLRIAVKSGPEGEAVTELAREYKAARIQTIPLAYSTLREQLVASMRARRSDFDVILLDDPWMPEFASSLVPLRAVPATLQSDIVPASLKLGKHPYGTGELRALPFVGNTQLFFVRKDLRSELGLHEMPTDWRALANEAIRVSALARRVGRQSTYGYAIRGRTGAAIVTDFLPLYWSLGGRLTSDEGGRRRVVLDDAKFREALEIYRLLLNASPPGALNYDWEDIAQDFSTGRSVFQLNWPIAIPKIEGTLGAQSFGSRWDITLPPKGSEKSTSMIGNWLLAIPAWAPNRNLTAAEEFIVWAVQNQEKVSHVLAPPSRRSVFEKLAAKDNMSYFATILQALENSTPRDRTERWSEIETAVSSAVTGYLARRLDEKQATDTLRRRLVYVIGQ